MTLGPTITAGTISTLCPLDISVYDGSVARPVELFNACSVNIGGGRPQAGVVDSGTLSFALCICISTAHHI